MTKPAVDAEASPVERMLQQAYDRQRRGNLAAAEALYESVLASDAERIEALNNLGAIAIHAGRMDRGIELVRRALQLNPQNADAHFNEYVLRRIIYDRDRRLRICATNWLFGNLFVKKSVTNMWFHFWGSGNTRSKLSGTCYPGSSL